VLALFAPDGLQQDPRECPEEILELSNLPRETCISDLGFELRSSQVKFLIYEGSQAGGIQSKKVSKGKEASNIEACLCPREERNQSGRLPAEVRLVGSENKSKLAE
jgi:hypothetical protein